MASIVSFRLIRFQLRLLSQRTVPGMVQLTDQSRRSCQDDSKQRKQSSLRSQSASSQKVTRAAGPVVSLLEKDLQDIVREREGREKLQERSSLQRRLDLLLSLGCTMDQIQHKVKVLDLSEQVILQRATMLKDIGCSPVTVNLLLSSSYASVDLLRKHVKRRMELDAATCKVLQCSPEELDQLKAEHPSLNRFRCTTADDIMEKSEVLHSYGITSEEIKAFPGILNIKVENIRQRLDVFKALREEGKLSFNHYPLNIVAQRTRGFEKSVENAILGRAEVDGSPISLKTIAQRLGVTAKDIEDATINFYKLGPSSVLKKIDYLLGEGISSTDIVSHIYIMKYRLQTLQRAVEKSKTVVVSHPPPVYILLSFLRSGHLPKKSFVWSRQRIFVASLLEVQVAQLPSSAFLRPLWSTDRMSIKRNFDFLISEGFSPEDILSCVVLLAHDPDHLQAYYLTFLERPDIAAHIKSGPLTDRKQTLSLLQYVIEKDMNFTSAVFNAEVELEPGLLEESDQKGSDSLETSFDED